VSVTVGPVDLEATTPDSSGRADTRHRVLVGALLALPVVLLAIAAWNYRWMSDDGFINLRVVSQIKAGNGPVFNAGERVEAATSPLWIAMLYLGDLLTPIRLEWVAVLEGIGLTLGGLGLAVFGAVRLQRGVVDHAIWLPAGALVFASFPPVWRFASSGLENGLAFAWLGACFAVLAGWARRERGLTCPAAVLLGLGPLVRPELTIVAAGFLVFVLAAQWRIDTWRRRFAILGSAVALPVAYEIFRMGYYASLVPNSAIAKEASHSYWSFGLTYLRQTVVDAYALWIPLVILAVAAYVPLVAWMRRAAMRRGQFVVAAFVVGALLDALYIVRVGGDFMHARLLLPSLFMLAAPVAVVPATRRFVGALLVVPWCFVVIVALRFPSEKAGRPGSTSANGVTLADYGFGSGGALMKPYTTPGLYAETTRLPGRPLAHDPALATYGVGTIGYALGPKWYVLDMLGLGDGFDSHLKISRRGIVGHEKPLPTPWVAARLLRPGSPVTAEDVPAPVALIAPIDKPDGDSFAARVSDARRALQCGPIKDFLASYQDRLDAGRFIDNIGDAFSNYGFRIPPEPRDALKKFCPAKS
jgi:arabinofuranosyltransferase